MIKGSNANSQSNGVAYNNRNDDVLLHRKQQLASTLRHGTHNDLSQAIENLRAKQM
jgi:hypothetical protein